MWSKNNFNNEEYDYDILLYIANWPEFRSFTYKSLLVARAIENQSFVIWVNRVGKDGNGIFHSGDSMVIDPLGNILEKTIAGVEEVFSIVLNRVNLIDLREKFKVGLDWDEFHINL